MHCPRCHHTQLSHVASRPKLFSHYLYQSGTSATLIEHFKWITTKVRNESLSKPEGQPGIVLEIACNDGSQLDQFKNAGKK